MYHIYKITSTTSGKSYIGVTKQSIQKRWYQHRWFAKRGSNSHFHRAIRKYGEDDFKIEHVFTGWLDRDLVEQEFIEYHNTLVEGYNATIGGEDFTSSEYQRNLQLQRVKDRTHPFVGGDIQRQNGIKRWKDGTHCFIGLNQIRIENGTHNLIGDSNPQRKRKDLGIPHHNNVPPWKNTKTKGEALLAWMMADELFDWYEKNKHKKRGGSYVAMRKHFNLNSSLQIMYYKYFQKGWNPRNDSSWVEWRDSL